MSIVQKVLNHTELNNLELLLNGAFAPLNGYLNQADLSSVLSNQRLSNGKLWPLPLALTLTAAEKLQVQHSERVMLLDDEQRVLAEVVVDSLYRLPSAEVALAAKFDPSISVDTWFASGQVVPIKKILHPAFNSIRHDVPTLKQNLTGWRSIVAVQAAPAIDQADLQRACEWLSGSDVGGGLLVQINANEQSADFHEQVRAIRSQVKCSSARQVKLSLLPCVLGLDAQRCALLQALVSRNYGATSFVLNSQVPAEAQRWLLQHRDEIGLEVIPSKRKQSINKTALNLAA